MADDDDNEKKRLWQKFALDMLRKTDKQFLAARLAYTAMPENDKAALRGWLKKFCEIGEPKISNGPVLVSAKVEISFDDGGGEYFGAKISAKSLFEAIEAWDRGDNYDANVRLSS